MKEIDRKITVTKIVNKIYNTQSKFNRHTNKYPQPPKPWILTPNNQRCNPLNHKRHKHTQKLTSYMSMPSLAMID